MSGNTPITVAYGDGIGPEIMQATLDIMLAAGAKLDIEVIEIGEKVYLAGNATDIGAAKMATSPEDFDVIVMENLYGDILSDVAAQMTGSVGLAGSANIGDNFAMFEAIHGSAPRRAGQNLANPTGLLLGAVLMLNHIGQSEVATNVHNAWLKTMEDGVHTYDIFKEGISKEKVGTKEFAQAVIARVGQKPSILKAVNYNNIDRKDIISKKYVPTKQRKDLIGVDVFFDWTAGKADDLGAMLSKITAGGLQLKLI
ncbi:unnamed protein product, partial [Rotaria sp. Silwood1]